MISSKDAIKLLPMSETFDFDRGLLLAVQAVQVEFALSVFSAWFTWKDIIPLRLHSSHGHCFLTMPFHADTS